MKKSRVLCFLLAMVFSIMCLSSCDKDDSPQEKPPQNNIVKSMDLNTANGVHTPEKPFEGAWYTMFINSFADSNADGKGDINGLIKKLDYLNDGDPKTTNDLGITGMWLLPVMPAATFHKYDIQNYYDIDPEYGTLADFDKLIEECDKRGIAVVIDLILNCTSNIHPWFLEALNDMNSPYRKYYHFYDDKPNKLDYDLDVKWNNYNGWSRYDKKGNPQDIKTGTGDIAASLYAGYMPDLNYDNIETKNEIKKIAKFWLDRGVAGFRLDSVPHIYSETETPKGAEYDVMNLDFWTEFFDYCKTINPDTYLVGEVLSGNTDLRAKYMKAIKSDFDYKIMYDIRDEYNSPKSGGLAAKIHQQYQTYKMETKDNYINAPFQTDADINRMSGVFGNDPRKIKQAQMISLTIEGLPFMYYGDELGMLGNKSSGEIFKLSFPWDKKDPLEVTDRYYFNIYGKKSAKDDYLTNASSDYMQPFSEQDKDPNSVLSVIRRLIQIRCSNEAMFKGRFTKFVVGGDVQSYKMVSKNQEAVIIHNFFDTEKEFDFDFTGYTLSFMTYSDKIVSTNGKVKLKPYESIILFKTL